MRAPLAGVKIIDLTRVLAGPFCTMLLGDMGADVIKVEEPTRGDESRGWAPFVDGWSSYFLGVNRNKRSIALDLTDADAKEILRALVREADVLVENFRPGSLTQLGFGYTDLQAINPSLIYCSISGYGQTGPNRELSGYDVVIQGESGFMDMTGQPDGPPTRAGIAVTDYLAGMYAVQGILLALLDRQRTSRGQHIDIALLDSLMSVMTLPFGILFATGEAPKRMGNEHPSVAPYEALPAADGQIIVAVGNPQLWTEFCRALDIEHMAHDSRFETNCARLENREALRQELGRIFAKHTVRDLLERLRRFRIPCGQVKTMSEAIVDPQIRERGIVVEIAHPTLGTILNMGNPIKLSESPPVVRLPPPALGEHTEAIIAELNDSKVP